MKVKVIQSHTSPVKIFLESKDITYGPTDKMDLAFIHNTNNGLIFETEFITQTCMINMHKCLLLGAEYENINMTWDHEARAVTWIKIMGLLEQFTQHPDFDVFVFLDSDAWIRDEKRFAEFLQTFAESPRPLAIPRDTDIPGNTYLNTGFIAVKNTKAARAILDGLFESPKYDRFVKTSWWEQGALSVHQSEHPEDIMVLPLEDFNTPCGSVVRHCWVQHIRTPLLNEEIMASFTKNTVMQGLQKGFKMGRDAVVYRT